MAEIAHAYVSLIPSAKGWSSQLSRSLDGELTKTGKQSGAALSGAIGGEMGKSGKSTASRFSSVFGGVLTRSVAGVGLAAGGVLSATLFKGWNRLGAIEDATAKLEGLGHSAGDVRKIMDNALAAVKGTAFGLDEAATVAAGAVAAGVKPGKQLQSTLGLVADASTIAGTSLSDMGAIFNKVATSNKVQGDVINQLNDQGIPIVQLLAKSMHKSTDEVLDLSRQGKIGFKDFSKAMQEGLGGAALKSGDTTSGAFKNMGAAMSRFGARLLSGLFPIAKTVFGGITRLLDDAAAHVGPFIDAVSAKLPAVVKAVKGLFSGGGGSLAPLLNALKGFAGAAFDAGKRAVPVLVSIGKALAPFAKFAIGASIIAVTVAFKALGPIVKTAASALGLVGDLAREHSTTFRVIAAVIAALFVPMLIVMGVQATIAAARVVAAWVLMKVESLQALAAQAVASASVVAGWVLMGVQSLLNAAKMAAAWVIALGPIAIVVAAVAVAVVLIIRYWDQIKSATIAVWNAIKSATLTVWNFIKDHLKTILEAIFILVTGPIGLLAVFIFENWDKIKAATKAAWDAVKNTVKTIVGGVVGFVHDKFNSLVGFFSGLPSKIGNAAKGMFDGIKNSFKDAINWIIDGWNGLEFKIPGFDPPGPGPEFGGFTLGLPDIPRLATGGLLTRKGSVMVGEDGPEILDLPKGARITPLDLAGVTTGSDGASLTVNNYYPEPEPPSQSVPQSLREASYVHGLAW